MTSQPSARFRFNRTWLFGGLAGAAALAAGVVGAAYLAPRLRPPLIVTVGLDAASVRAVSALAAASAAAGGPKFRVAEVADWSGLSAKRAPKPDLVIGPDGLAARSGDFKPLAADSARALPDSMRSAGRDGERRYALPLQFDHFELLYSPNAFAAAKLAPPRDLAALAAALDKLGAAGALALPGGEDDALLEFVGAWVEAWGGLAAYRSLAEALAAPPAATEGLRAGDGPAAALAAGSAAPLLDRDLGGLTLRRALDRLVEWRKLGRLHPAWFRMTANDFGSLLADGRIAVAALPLSLHRRQTAAVMERFEALVFPAAKADAPRGLQSVAWVGAVPAKSVHAAAAEAFLYSLASPASQTALAAASGLAPAAAVAETADRQAADARLWLAASQGPLVDLGRASCLGAVGRAALAQAFRDYFTVDGVGY
jgi:hypothetical protein